MTGSLRFAVTLLSQTEDRKRCYLQSPITNYSGGTHAARHNDSTAGSLSNRKLVMKEGMEHFSFDPQLLIKDAAEEEGKGGVG